MKREIRLFFFALLINSFFTIVFAQNIFLTQSNESGIYKRGEKIEVSVYLQAIETDSILVTVRKNYSEEYVKQKIEYKGDILLLYEQTAEKPISLIFEVWANKEFASIGAVVEPERFTPGTERPLDFDDYWDNEKKSLRSLPLDIKSVQLHNVERGYVCYDVEMNCTGPKPARGYFAKPESAKEKSLPAVLYVHAAGVSGAWCLSEPENALNYAKMGQGTLCFDLNAHGMLNGQPVEYYNDLEKGELKNYFFHGVENKNNFYFRGMYLRLMRTLDFLTTQPEWDGERLLVIGESQGGGQALAAAGLDKRVSAAVATVPAMCDWGGALVGRKGGWPDPFNTKNDKEKMLETCPYFDAAHILKDSEAILVTEIGFIDTTCPSTSIYAAINQARGEKIIYVVPYRAHHLSQKKYTETWENTVNKPKLKFIAEYLK